MLFCIFHNDKNHGECLEGRLHILTFEQRAAPLLYIMYIVQLFQILFFHFLNCCKLNHLLYVNSFFFSFSLI